MSTRTERDKAKTKIKADEECPIAKERRLATERAQSAGHLYATRTEQRNAAHELRRLLMEVADDHREWMPNLGCAIGSGQGSLEIDALRERMVTTVLQAVNFQRFGHADTSLAKHPDGRFARRYFSNTLRRLVWGIFTPPGDSALEVSDRDDLGYEGEEAKWKVVDVAPWRVIL